MKFGEKKLLTALLRTVTIKHKFLWT